MVEELLRIAWWEWRNERIAAAIPTMLSADIERFFAIHGDDATG